MESKRYGLVTLGEIQSFLRDIIEDDELYNFYYENEKLKGKTYDEIPKKASCGKIWDRYCKEETKNKEKVQDYIDYSLNSENSIYYLYSLIKTKLSDNYDFDSSILDFINFLVFSYYDSLKNYNFNKDKAPYYLAGEFTTNSQSCIIWAKAISYIIAIHLSENGADKTKALLNDSVSLTYKELFDELKNELNCNSLEKLYEKLGYDYSKKVIMKANRTDSSPLWVFIENILPSCSQKLQNKFIFKFLLKKTIESAKKNLCIYDENLESIKAVFIEYADETKDFDFEAFIKKLAEKLTVNNSNKQNCKSPLALALYKNIYEQKMHKTISEEQMNSAIDLLNQKAPEIAPFFIPWFRALLEISKRDFNLEKYEDPALLKASNLFDEAFNHKYLAGDFIKEFLEQGFVLENYINSSFSLITRAYKYDGINEKQKNPVSCDAKKFLNFGYAIGLFPKNAEEESTKALSANDLFNTYFDSSYFINEEAAKNKVQEEFENEYYLEIDNNISIYDNLSKIPASKRNNLVFIKDIVSNDSRHNSKQKQLYPPINLCIQYSLQDERLLDLALSCLEDNENPINTTKVSYTGRTALCVAFYTYKYFRLNRVSEEGVKAPFRELLKDKYELISDNFDKTLEKEEFQKDNFKEKLIKANAYEKKLKKIIDILIEKTDFESELKFSEKISTLSYAIDAFDFNYVKKLVEKIPEDIFQDYHLYGNISPLMFAIHRKQPVSLGFEEFIRITKDISVPCSLNNSRLSFTREEIFEEYNYYNPRPKDIDEYWYHHDQKEKEITEEDIKWYSENYGTPENPFIQSFQVRELDNIIDFFLSKTKNSDSYKRFSRSSDGDMLWNTALIYAAQHNDNDTCRKLLKMGATDSSNDFGFYSFKYGENKYLAQNNLINNLCLYKCWETLIMIFDEYPQLIEKSLNPEAPFLDSFAVFATTIKNRFIWTGREKREYKDIVEYLLDRFIDAGANPEKETPIGSVKKILAGTKLLN